jgi:hypothetical protein
MPTQDRRRAAVGGCRLQSHQRRARSSVCKGHTGLQLKALHVEHAPIEIQDPELDFEVGDKIG